MKTLLPLILILSLTGCAGTMQGKMQNGKSVQFYYEDKTWDTEISTTLPDGENFKGKYVQKTEETTGLLFGLSGGALGAGSTVSNEMVATLFGDKGHTMQCSFSTLGTIRKKGVGACKVSDGRKIDLIF